MDAEEKREAYEFARGTDADPHTVFCPSCGSSDLSWRTRTFEEPSGRTLEGETSFLCNQCENEWTEL